MRVFSRVYGLSSHRQLAKFILLRIYSLLFCWVLVQLDSCGYLKIKKHFCNIVEYLGLAIAVVHGLYNWVGFLIAIFPGSLDSPFWDYES